MQQSVQLAEVIRREVNRALDERLHTTNSFVPLERVADRLGCSRKTLSRYAQRGLLPPMRQWLNKKGWRENELASVQTALASVRSPAGRKTRPRAYSLSNS